MQYGVIQDKKPQVLKDHLSLGGRNEKEEIQVNSRFFIKDGCPWIPIMGEIHYSRVEEGTWERELLKMKAGGITVVSCYVIWIYHEEQEGIFDFSGNRNLDKFLKTVEQVGLKVFLRIGPWVHGEVRNGGFPDWLLKKGCKLRQDDPEYLNYVTRYFEKIMEQAGEYLFYENGPIWGIQIENELTNQAGHLLTLRRMAEKTGLKVPIYTVTGWNSKYGAEIPEYDVIPVFGGYPEAPWENSLIKLEPNSNYFFLPARNDSSIGKDLIADTDDNPNVFHMKYELYPYVTCELGGGIQVTHHRRPIIGGDDVAALALVKLGCGNNMPGYYMYHGGTNDISLTTLQESKATGYPNDYPIRSYDFQAPIGEYGQIRNSYRRLKLQHLFILAFMKQLAPMDAFFQEKIITDRYDKSSLRYCIRTDGHSGFVFVNNFQRLDELDFHDEVQFAVPCEGGKMIFPDPGMSVPSGSYFILPYNLKMGTKVLRYATAQLLYQKENTWFFFTPFGIMPEYCFEGKNGEKKIIRPKPGKAQMTEIFGTQGETILIVTLTQEEAEHFFVLDNDVYLTDGAELYRKGRAVCSYRRNNPDLSYSKWDGRRFKRNELAAEAREMKIEYHTFTPILSEYSHADGLFLDGPKRTIGYTIEITKDMVRATADAFLEISYLGDVLQIYVDKVLVADDFCKGIPYEVSISYLLKYGTKIELLISELKKEECYLEKEMECTPELKTIKWVPVWEHIG